MTTAPAGCYDRTAPEKNYEKHLFRSGEVLQSAELNELQTVQSARLKGVADVLFKDGALIRDCSININIGTGVTACASGAVYARGAVRGVVPATLTIPLTGYVAIGFRLAESYISETDDPDLRDPAVGLRNYREPGSWRLKTEARWAHHLDGGSGEFFAVYDVWDGVVSPKEAPPQIDTVSSAIRRYDQESTGGSYAIAGLGVSMGGVLPDDTQFFRINEGSARVDGRHVTLEFGRSYSFSAAPDLHAIDSEPHLSGSLATTRIATNLSPIQSITSVHITKQKTVTIVHGGYSGVMDVLPDDSVISIVSVVQGGTTYVATTSYLLTSGSVDWTPVGPEPSTGSSYDVTYKYITAVSPELPDITGFSVTGAVVGTLILVSYLYKMPRIDRLCMDSSGLLSVIRGVPSASLPHPPSVPRNMLLLATATQAWVDYPALSPSGAPRMVPMDVLDSYSDRLDRLLMLTAISRLESNAAARDASLKKSILTDPFIDDSMRDAGQAQTAAIFNGTMALPVRLSARYFSDDITVPETLESTSAVVVSQESRTGTMAVNPYSSFSPIPAIVVLTPSVDQMSIPITEWASDKTSRIVVRLPYGSTASQSSSEIVNKLNAVRTYDQYIRPQNVYFTLSGFDAGETLQRVAFDNVDVPAINLVSSASPIIADANGVLSGKFGIPPITPVGIKLVQFIGSHGNYGSALFTAASWQENTTLQRSITEYIYEYDPPILPPPVSPPPPSVVVPESCITYPPENPPPDDPTPEPPSRPIVVGLYWDLLGRAPEPAGVTHWQNLIAGGLSGVALIEAFVNSAKPLEPMTTTGEAIWNSNHCVGGSNVDPLAQTFISQIDAHISGVDLWFAATGGTDVVVQLRSTVNGLPTKRVLAECRLRHADIVTNGAHTRCAFEKPYYATSDEELAIAVLCNDASTAVDIAELGKWNGSAWVTEQPYTVGVLLSSSNNLTWTAHQDRDLRFRVLRSVYTGNTRTINLGSVAVDSVTDVMVLGLASKPATPADVVYQVTIPGGIVKTVPANVPITLSTPVTGNISVSALLSGSATVSPVLHPGGQLAYGWLGQSGTYISRATIAGTSVRVRVIVDVLLPSGSALSIAWKSSELGASWSSDMPLITSSISDNGFVEMVYEVTGITADQVQVKITSTGTPAARPFVKNLRVMVM